jgi:tRNA pseudouridine32 synthase / 23S rRNA pseudouridine746 synthase
VHGSLLGRLKKARTLRAGAAAVKQHNPAMVIVHADDALIVIDKPAGMLAVPGRGDDKRDSASLRVQAACPDALVVHRLDMATSGLMILARGAAAQRALSIAFERREVDKRYVAVVSGSLPDEGVIDLPITVDWPRRPLQHVDYERGKPSLTRWRVLAREPDRTRVELQPVTGRSHQLRVHLRAIGHPIVGDALYAPPEVQAWAPRLLLHASRLTLTHPACNDRVTFRSEPAF